MLEHWHPPDEESGDVAVVGAARRCRPAIDFADEFDGGDENLGGSAGSSTVDESQNVEILIEVIANILRCSITIVKRSFGRGRRKAVEAGSRRIVDIAGDRSTMRLTIRAKMLTALLVLSLAPLFVVCLITLWAASQLLESTSQALLAHAVAVADKIDRNLFERYSDAKVFGLNRVVTDRTTWYRRDHTNAVAASMNRYIDTYSIYYLALLVDLEGRLIAVNSVDGSGRAIDTGFLYDLNFANSAWFRDALEGKFLRSVDGSVTGTVVDDLYVDPMVVRIYGDDGLALGFSAPVDDDAGKTIAVWRNVAKFSLVEEVVQAEFRLLESQGYASAELTLLNKNGDVIVDYDPAVSGNETVRHDANVIGRLNLVGENEDAARRAIRGEAGGIPYSMNSRKKVFQTVGFTPLKGAMGFPGMDWRVLVRVDSDKALRASSMLQTQVAILFPCVSAAVLIAGARIAATFARPIHAITAALKEMAEGKGNPPRRLDESRTDELGDLARWFNAFAGKLRQTINLQVKELTCLHEVAKILQDDGLKTADWLRLVAEALPAGWQYPEITTVRIRYGATEYATSEFIPTQWMRRAEFADRLGRLGAVEIAYLAEKPAEAEGSLLTDEGHLIRSVAEMLRSAIDRRVAEAALQERETILRLFVEHAPTPIAMFDQRLCYLHVSRKWMTVYRLGERNIIGLSHYDVFPEVPPHWKLIHSRCLAGAVERCDEEPFERPDGTTQWLRWEIRPWVMAGGEIGGIIMFTEDITQSKQAEKALRESEARFRTLVEHAPEAIVVLDVATKKFVNVNENAVRLFGLPRETLLATGPIELSPPKQSNGRSTLLVGEERIGQAVAGEAPAFEWLHRNAEGKDFPCEVRLVLLPASERTLVRGSITDITERKRVEVALQRHMQELDGANRDLEAKNREIETFVYSVSHDLRSPLVNLQGFSKELGLLCNDLRALLGRPGTPAEVARQGRDILDGGMAKSVRYILTAVVRLSVIIDALLRLSRAGRVVYQWRMADLNELVGRVVAAMESTIEQRGATVEVRNLPAVWGDATALEQVFANLIGNAVNYLDPARQGRIEVGVIESDPMVTGRAAQTIYIQDNGLGIAEAYHSKLFQAFQRLHPDAATGEGMGLKIVQRIVERHNGRIWVESKVGVGSTFFVTLPTSPASVLSI